MKTVSVDVDSPDIARRNILKFSISMGLMGLLPGCFLETKNSGPIVVNTENVKSLDDLVGAIKTAGGSRFPRTPTLDECYSAFADTCVENARKAVDIGIQVPNWILDRLPKKAALENSNVKPEWVAVGLLGLILLIPISVFFIILFASLITMTRFITEAINKMRT